MDGYIQTGFSILVSLVLFFITYRQTIGAKKERMRTTNAEIEKILVRRLVVEDYNISLSDMHRLIEGKGRDFNLSPDDLYDEDQHVNIIYTRIMESDLINQEQRKILLKRIEPLLKQSENEAESIPKVTYDAASKSGDGRKLSVLAQQIVLAFLVSIIGASFSLIGKADLTLSNISGLLSTIAIPITVTLTVITLILTIRKYKEPPKDVALSSRSTRLQTIIDFEKQVALHIQKVYKNVQAASIIDQGFDFIIEEGSKKILIDVKSWRSHVPSFIVAESIKRLQAAITKHKASMGIFVVNQPVTVPERLLIKKNIRIMTIDEFRSSRLT